MSAKTLKRYIGSDANRERELACALKTEVSCVRRWLKGQHLPSPRMREAIEAATGGVVKQGGWAK